MKPESKTKTPPPRTPLALYLAWGVVWAVGAWQPLFTAHAFADLPSAKLAWMLVLTFWSVLLLGVAGCLTKAGRGAAQPPGLPAVAVAALAAETVLSAALCGRADAWVGLLQRCNGALLAVCVALCYLLMRVWGGPALRQTATAALQVGTGAAALLTLLNYISWDPLGLFVTLNFGEDRLMTSTLGNVNFAAVLYLMVTVLTLWQLLQPAPPGSRYALAARYLVWALTSTALLCCTSNGAVLGLAAALAAMACRAGFSLRGVRRALLLLSVTLYTGAAVGLAALLERTTHRVDALFSLLLTPWAAVAGTAVLLLYLALRKRGEGAAHAGWQCSKTVCRCVVLALVAAAVAVALAANLLPGLPLAPLRFGPAWGSNRGFVWGLTPALYGGLPPLQKLFGVGPDGVYALLNPAYTEQIVALNHNTFDSMHNEYLQTLLCGGVVGLLLWAGVLGVHLYRGLRSTDPLAQGAAFAVLAYAAQAVFNIAMPVTTPALYLLLAVCAATPPPHRTEATPRPTILWFLFAVLPGLLIWPQAVWLTG